MELTFESAFSAGGMVGNASYVLLIASMAMRDMFWLRVLAIFSGLTGIAYDVFWLSNPVGVFWESLFTLVNLIQWLFLISENYRQRLNQTERTYRDLFFPEMKEPEAKLLFKNAIQQTISAGSQLTSQGNKVDELIMIVRGKVRIEKNGQEVSSCREGDFLGEISFLTGDDASATAIADSEVLALRFGQEEFTKIINRSELLMQTVNASISKNLVKKLHVQSQIFLNSALV